jgi:exopolysaccharide production protein ExoY
MNFTIGHGLWQVEGRNETTYAQRDAFDVDYLRNWSFTRDLTIVLMTFRRSYQS